MPPGSPICWPDPVEFRSGAGNPGTTLAAPQAVGSRADEPWVQKTLEDANIKLDCVISDILRVSGRAMIEALIAGEIDPDTLAELANRRLKASREQLREALRGRVTDHHRFLLQLHLGQIDALTAAAERVDRQVDTVITRMDAAVEAGQAPVQAVIGLLITVPGIGPLAARMILAEIGRDMSRFPSAAHLLSWAGLCPRNDESAGKRRSARLRKGAPWLKTVLVQCAATRKKGSWLNSIACAAAVAPRRRCVPWPLRY